METGGAERAQAGRVITFKVTGAGAFIEEDALWQATADDTVSGTAEADDRFGEKVTAINTAPRAVSTAANLRVAVGVPGEAVGTAAKAGAIETFPLLGAAGDSEVWIEAGNAAGLAGTPAANQYVGRSTSGRLSTMPIRPRQAVLDGALSRPPGHFLIFPVLSRPVVEGGNLPKRMGWLCR
ncbi:hypothetical protein [Streptomyces sp. NPDC007883]|uniref:hypothetical protein n=1 Tax=Streptomyces sp. NPDC007883 TaxID=3155116 RepID=UPI0033D4116C